MDEPTALIAAVRKALTEAGDASKAPEMQRYMKSELPYRGVTAPERKALTKRLFTKHTLSSTEDLQRTAQSLWREAKYREERYAAIDLTGQRQYAQWQTPELLPLYEEMIVTGAWWDYVDEVANRRIGPLLSAYRTELTPVMHTWAKDPDLWKRRTSIICQLSFKSATDTELLTAAIEANTADRDFFIRKGIGWALRQFARTEPGWVRSFVDAHPELSPLSVREAVKHL